MRPKLRKVIQITCAVLALLIIFLLSVAYIQYRELKKTLAVKISDKASAFIGQKVDIEDLSFSPSAGINLYNITVKNPEGFAAGDLLRIKKIFIKLKYGDLAKGRLYFTNITVYSPAVSILRNEQGRINISDRLFDFFKKKPTSTYQIDDFEMKSGSFRFRDSKANLSNSGGEGGLPDEIFRNDNINIRIKSLSSYPGIKTSISGHTIFAGGSEIAFDGWAYLKDDPKKLNISISSNNISLAPLKELLGRYGVSTEKTQITFSLNSEGDTDKGFRVKAEIGIKEAELKFFKKDSKEILVNIQAFLNMRGNSLALENISLQSGKSAAVALRGEIRDLFKEPVYTADLKIGVLDLSAFNFVTGPKVSGVVTSDNVHVRGAFGKSLPEISGDIQLKDASLVSNDDEIREINASMKFSSRGEMTIDADASAELLKSSGYLLDKPAKVRLLLTARGNLKNMSLKSSLDIFPVGARLRDGKAISSKNISFFLDGNMKPDAFVGKSRVEMDLTLADYHLPWLRGVFAFERRGNIFTVMSPALDGGSFKSSAGRVTVRLPEKGKGEKQILVEVKGLSASYPEEAAGLKKADISLQLDAGGRVLSGDLRFSLSGITYRGLNASVIAGRSRFDGKGFSVDVPRAEMAGGTVQLAATGSTKEGPFPAKLRIVAESIDIGALSKEALKISGIPYEISGDLKRASFEGLLESVRSVRGNSGVTAEKITLRRRDSKRELLKGVTLDGTMEFRGKDVDFKADAAVGKVVTGISGTMKDFQMSNRSADVRIKLPSIGAAELRDSLWDSFPDSLLYAGLSGSLSADFTVDYRESDLKVNGGLAVRELSIRGENGEYSVGPINGVLPVAYSKAGGKGGGTINMPSFDRSEFDGLSRFYSKDKMGGGDSLITIGSLQYGFRFLENVTILVKQEGSVLNVRHFSGALFGGKLNGTAVVDLSKGFSYRVGMLLEGLSMMRLCEEIEPIKGYISGKVNGIALLKGSGSGVSQVIGKADFWTYGTNEETTKISREFLKKIGGPSVKAYLGDRRFDRGEMSLYLQNGFVIFKDLEISHKNILGMRDLSIQVAPLNNRVAIDHLMWSVTEAAQRAKEK